MAKLIKNVGYGIVARSVNLRVFLTPEKYIEAVNESKSYNINAKTDSELINRILDIFIKHFPIPTVKEKIYLTLNENGN